MIFNMLKKILIFALLPISCFANDCIEYKHTPNIKINSPVHKKSVVQSDEQMDKYHGNVIATLVEDYDIAVDIFSITRGYCVVLKSVDALIGYNDFSVKIDSSHTKGSCSYNAILNHEDKHINAYLSVLDDLSADINSSVFNAADSVMPIFVSTREDIDSAIEEINYEMRHHPELILMKQKISSSQEIRNKRIDQNEDNHELKSCLVD